MLDTKNRSEESKRSKPRLFLRHLGRKAPHVTPQDRPSHMRGTQISRVEEFCKIRNLGCALCILESRFTGSAFLSI